MGGNSTAPPLVSPRVAEAWSQIRRGATSPLVVVRLARAAGEPWRAYRRLVLLHVVLAIAVMAVSAPFVLRGVRFAAERGATMKVGSDHVSVHVEKRRGRDDSDDTGSVRADDDGGDKPPAFLVTHAPSLVTLWIALGSLYAAWVLIELGISMVWMEHLDWLTERLTEAVGLPVLQPRTASPRLRFSIRWGLQKAWRQIIGALLIASGAPFFAIVMFAPQIGPMLYGAALALWTFYWLMVTTAAKSATAWAAPAPYAPWFLRLWTGATTKVPGLRWFVPRAYGSLWNRLTLGLQPAAVLWEARPYTLGGLALVRLGAQLPFVSLVVKPLLPTAAELIVSGRLDAEA